VTHQSFLVCALVCRMAFGLTATGVEAATVEGKLLHRDNTPAARISVTLANNQGRTAPVQSDTNGSYMLYNIPAGEYYLEVWVDPRKPQTDRVTIHEPSTTLRTEAVP
jgi:hypothetical protein